MLDTLSSIESASEEPLDAYSRAIMSVVETVGPSVVRVENRRQQGGGSGSGFIIAHDGLLLTSAHVVAGAAELVVSAADGRRARAVVLGEDPDTDLAQFAPICPAICRSQPLAAQAA
jgi:S1-C subfamily serine protease